MKFHHLGIACADIPATMAFILHTQDIATQSAIIFDERQNASLCMIETASGFAIELIAGPVVKNYVKKGIHIYHTCWQVADLEQGIKNLTDQGAMLIAPPTPAVLFQERPVAFLHTPLGLVELLAATCV